MSEDRAFELDFSKLPANISDGQIEGCLMAFDNLDQSLDPDKKRMAESYCFPTRSELFVMVLCLKGSAKFKINIKEEIVTPNSLLIIVKGAIFEVLEVDEDFQGIVLLVNAEVFRMSDDAVVSMSLRQYFAVNHNIAVGQDMLIELLDLYKLMKRQLQKKDNPFRNQIVQRYCQVVAYEAYHAFLNSPLSIKEHKNRKDEIFESFISLVEKHYKKERSIKFYAELMCLSPKYLSGVVKDVSHKFAGEWIDDYVILEAKAMLKQGGYTIQQISDNLNFPNQSFFGRYFKHHTGYPPKDYRKL